MILIVSPAKDRSNIMKAVMAHAGIESKAQSIVISLPVSSAYGLRNLEEDSESESVDFHVSE